jgi:hypothetical protein
MIKMSTAPLWTFHGFKWKKTEKEKEKKKKKKKNHNKRSDCKFISWRSECALLLCELATTAGATINFMKEGSVHCSCVNLHETSA